MLIVLSCLSGSAFRRLSGQLVWRERQVALVVLIPHSTYPTVCFNALWGPASRALLTNLQSTRSFSRSAPGFCYEYQVRTAITTMAIWLRYVFDFELPSLPAHLRPVPK